jgi:hypothetical protein
MFCCFLVGRVVLAKAKMEKMCSFKEEHSMAIVKCAECGNDLSDKADKCPHCGANKKDAIPPKPAPKWVQAAVIIFGSYLVFSCVSGGGSSSKSSGSSQPSFGHVDALTMCQMALKRSSRDPDKAEVPYVNNQGSGNEFYYAWGPGTKVVRMRNGLGLEVAASASCIVDGSTKRITSLTLNGESII